MYESPIIEMLVQAYSLILNETERTISGHHLSNSNFFYIFSGLLKFCRNKCLFDSGTQIHKDVISSEDALAPLYPPPPLSLAVCVCFYIDCLTELEVESRKSYLLVKKEGTQILYTVYTSLVTNRKVQRV